ncbi:hypothetical protein BD779DRAFT_1519912 [Infundibulicybe gibba]|nr:hypothetical protein BD779DRAFT_1519912 [Infundibulicybe gibba]
MCGVTVPSDQEYPSRNWRRRSADVGGLHLATGNRGQGQGWLGCTGELHTRFAELLGDMYTQTLNAVNEHNSVFAPTDLPTETRSRLILSLEEWHFEPHKLPEEEVLSCTLILFEALFRIEGMEQAIGISMDHLSPFIHHLRQIYRWENSYHNFEHALDVLQASHSYLRSAGMVPPLSILLEPHRKWKPEKAFDSGPIMTCLGLQELFVVYIAAIGHDVGHPGFTNVFMKNAQTPLSVVFDGRSALEQMHCQLLLRVMRHHGLGPLLDNPSDGFHFRKLLWETVLATDMSVHANFMTRFELAITEKPSLANRQILICQAILKCADISNPSRPYSVSQHWASALMSEWTSQASLERHLDLPTTVQPTDDPLSEAKSQVFFINMFAKPLLELTTEAVPEMRVYTQQCASNLELWAARKQELETEMAGPTQTTPTAPSLPRRDDYTTAFPLALPSSRRSLSQEGPSWPTAFSDSSCASSESSACSPCDSVASFVFSPVSDAPSPHHTPRPPSSSGSSSGQSNGTNGNIHLSPNDGHIAIRAAGKLGPRKQKIINRNSWSASTSLSYATHPPHLHQHPLVNHTQPTVALLVSRKAAPTSLMASAPDTIVVAKPMKFEKNGALKS